MHLSHICLNLGIVLNCEQAYAQPALILHVAPKIVTVQFAVPEECNKTAHRRPNFSRRTILYVLDGKPIWTDVVPAINPDDIARIRWLEPIAAAFIYGSRGADGAIVVTTKWFPAKYLHRIITKKGQLD